LQGNCRLISKIRYLHLDFCCTLPGSPGITFSTIYSASALLAIMSSAAVVSRPITLKICPSVVALVTRTAVRSFRLLGHLPNTSSRLRSDGVLSFLPTRIDNLHRTRGLHGNLYIQCFFSPKLGTVAKLNVRTQQTNRLRNIRMGFRMNKRDLPGNYYAGISALRTIQHVDRYGGRIGPRQDIASRFPCRNRARNCYVSATKAEHGYTDHFMRA
jgi:hypothetical protein